MNALARPLLVLVAFAAAIASSLGPAAARRAEVYLGPPATPQPTLGPLSSPGPGTMATQSPDACANDRFLALRTIPQPGQYPDQTVCGVVVALPAGSPASGAAPAARFAVVADGTAPLPVSASATANPGDNVLVHGRFRRDVSGAETLVATYVVVNGVTTPSAAQR